MQQKYNVIDGVNYRADMNKFTDNANLRSCLLLSNRKK